MSSHHDIDEVLRTLDAANGAPPPDSGRARADLDRILSVDAASQKALPPIAPRAKPLSPRPLTPGRSRERSDCSIHRRPFRYPCSHRRRSSFC